MKWVSWVCLILLAAFTSGGSVFSAEKPVLRIINWSEYIDLDSSEDEAKPIPDRSPTLRAFAIEFDCTVEYYEYESAEEYFHKTENMPQFYDLAIVSIDIASKLVAEKRLTPIAPESVPNWKNLSPAFLQQLKKYIYFTDCFVPYMIGTSGIAYRKDLVGHEVNSWKDFFEPPEKLKGKLAFQDTYSSLFFAMRFLNIDIRTTKSEEMQKAARLFLNLKKNGYARLITNNVKVLQNQLTSGKLAMAIMYSGDALNAMRSATGKQIDYVVPKEGSEIYVDGMVILRDAPHKDLAHQFINFILRPEIHAANAVYLSTLCPNEEALKRIQKSNPEYINNPNINLSDEIMKRVEIFNSPATENELRQLWSEISPNAEEELDFLKVLH